MATDPMEKFDDSNDPLRENQEAIAQKSRLAGKRDTYLPELLALLRRTTDALVPDYHIVEQRHPLPRGAGEGIQWGVSLRVEQLETALDDLQAAVVDEALTAEAAASEARALVIAAVPELRFGARLRNRWPIGRSIQLPPIAELGRLCALVRHLADELAALEGDWNGGGSAGGMSGGPHPTMPSSTVRLHIRSMK